MSHRIVIAEDELDIRANLTRLLTLENYEVWAAPNGLEALQLVRQHLPDIVLSDVTMPEMTGHQLVQALRADPRTAHIPTVLLTAKTDRGDVREGMNLGADDYLTKPFQRDELLGCIRAQLDKASTQQLAARQLASQAHQMAHFDAVTSLPNRSHLLLLLGQALREARGHGPALWVVGLDSLPQMAQIMGVGLLDDAMRQMARLDSALSAARARSAQRMVVHEPSSTSDLSATFRLHNDLHHAVEREELRAFFQSQVMEQDSSLIGFEALMHWCHPAL